MLELCPECMLPTPAHKLQCSRRKGGQLAVTVRETADGFEATGWPSKDEEIRFLRSELDAVELRGQDRDRRLRRVLLAARDLINEVEQTSYQDMSVVTAAERLRNALDV